MTRAELIEHLAKLHHEQLQVAHRMVNWRKQLVSSVPWDRLDEADRIPRRKAMESMLDELDRMDLIVP